MFSIGWAMTQIMTTHLYLVTCVIQSLLSLKDLSGATLFFFFFNKYIYLFIFSCVGS